VSCSTLLDAGASAQFATFNGLGGKRAFSFHISRQNSSSRTPAGTGQKQATGTLMSLFGYASADQESHMPVSSTPALERLARVLAGYRLSANADGIDPHASSAVDREWSESIDDALAVLRTLREPDADMAAAGDVGIWERMILAAMGHWKHPSSKEP
jgi:hypothetical protein